MKVYDLARQCQFVDAKWIKCGRRAETLVRLDNGQLSFRCSDHRSNKFSWFNVEPGALAGLGYPA